ncbi:hypothetical protein ACRRTK_000737 [Alexandromys fortis]
MNLMPVLTLLGVTTLLPGVPALRCQSSRIEAVRNASELPLEWNTGEETCEVGDGCQDLVMLLENGPQINLLISKGCVKIEDQEPQVTWLRTGPGLSIVSYIRVCRHSDFCNDVSSTKVLGDLPTPTVPGTLSCPLCLSEDGCENAPMQVCPADSTHCYNGVLRLRGDNIITNLKVQGCMPQPDCNLLNGTKAIGTLDMSEKCGLQLGPQALDCNSVALDTVWNVSELHLSWTTGWKICEAGQGCLETLMLIQNGQEFHMVLSKGCTSAANREAQITRHRTGPGISIITYVHVCRHRDFCNDLSTTENLWTPPPDTGGITTNLRVQGCMPESGCNLFDGTKVIGPIRVSENCGPQSGAQALECRSGKAEALMKVSSLPLGWTTSWETCKIGEGCQETVLLIVNGPNVNLVFTKGCTADEDHKPRITRHRTGPGVSIISYTHVCRHWDFCNDLSSTHPLWIPPPVTEGLISELKVQGCMSQPGCDLLNGTQTIGPIDVREDCGPQLGPRTLLLGSKGCSGRGAEDNGSISIYSQPPGMVVASYTRFCSSNLCNEANSSSVLLNSLPRPNVPPPGDLQCPACVELSASCFQSTNFVTCPQGTTRCYKGDLELQGGGVSSTLSLQGCMSSPNKTLLGGSRTIGIFSTKELFEDEENDQKPLDGALLQFSVPRSHTFKVKVAKCGIAAGSIVAIIKFTEVDIHGNLYSTSFGNLLNMVTTPLPRETGPFAPQYDRFCTYEGNPVAYAAQQRQHLSTVAASNASPQLQDARAFACLSWVSDLLFTSPPPSLPPSIGVLLLMDEVVEAIPTSRHGERGCFHVSREVIRRSPGKGGRHPESITKRKDTVVPWGNLEPVNRIFSGGGAVTKSGSKACQLHPTGENVGSVTGNSPIGGSWVEKAGSEGPNV